MGVEFQFGVMTKMVGGDGCTTMQVYLMPLCYVLKDG